MCAQQPIPTTQHLKQNNDCSQCHKAKILTSTTGHEDCNAPKSTKYYFQCM